VYHADGHDVRGRSELANLQGDVETIQMKDLLPRAFDTKFLK
jgi:hypothetical protein